MTRSRFMTVIVAMVAVLSLSLAGSAAAQDATPGASPAAATGHPAHIHNGTCDDLGEVVYPLSNVVPFGNEGQVATSTTNIDASLDDLTADSHALNVHESPENIQNYIACGNVDGPVVEGQMMIALHPLNDSGYAGVAMLSDAGDGTTDVVVYLISGLAS